MAPKQIKPDPKPMTWPEARRIAVAADVDPRSVMRFTRGEALRFTTADRISKVLREKKLTRFIPDGAAEELVS